MSSTPRTSRLLRSAAMAAVALTLAGCANGTALAPHDPLEPVNRSIHTFNKGIDTVIVRPVAKYAYKELVPGLVRLLVVNALDYLSTPASLVNAALQGNVDRTAQIGKRFFVNTTIGGLGLLDPATEIGLPALDEDFGQTLAVWGVGSGPYLTIPFTGPSTARDFVGGVVDRAFKPTSYFGLIDDIPVVLSPGATAVGLLEFRASNEKLIDDALYNSGDSYALTRSVFLQRRESQIRNGVVDADSGPDIFDDAY